MVEKSTVLLIVFCSFVVGLSFRDMMDGTTTASTPADKEKQLKMDLESNLEDDRDLNGDAGYEEKNFDMDDFNDMEETEDSKSNDFESSPTTTTSHEQVNMKKIPSLKMKSNVQTLKFRYCYSCGYRNMFEQYSAMVLQRYPDLNIVGENYAPVAWKLYITQFLGTFKILLIGIVIFGQNPFVYLQMPTPNIFNWATENKLYASLMIFFISNAIETQLITSGAFEIYLNDMQIWSKLQSDRIPHEKELLQMLDMNFNFESDKTNSFAPKNDGNFRI